MTSCKNVYMAFCLSENQKVLAWLLPHPLLLHEGIHALLPKVPQDPGKIQNMMISHKNRLIN